MGLEARDIPMACAGICCIQQDDGLYVLPGFNQRRPLTAVAFDAGSGQIFGSQSPGNKGTHAVVPPEFIADTDNQDFFLGQPSSLSQSLI